MVDKIEITMEIDGMMMGVVAEYAFYGSVARLETIMDIDGEPLDLDRNERIYLQNRIKNKHQELREVA